MKRRVRRYAEGGETGYEENPEPGVRADEETERRKPPKIRKKGKESRKVSAMEFIRKYEDSPASSRIREEAASAVRKSKQSLPSDRATNFASQAKETGMTPDERADVARKGIVAAASLVPAAYGASLAAKGLKTAKRRYDIGKRVDAMTEAQQKSAFLRAAREAKEVDGMRSGGVARSSASRRADGIAKKGKTRGRMI